MDFKHTSVLLEASLDMLAIEHVNLAVDCTLGGGGHSEAILKKLPPTGKLIGIDRDEAAILAAGKRLEPYGERFRAIRGNFFDIADLLQEHHVGKADAIIADLGVSSYQLDEAERGFSYQNDAPLDMRMDRRSDLSAYHIVNQYSHGELTRILKEYGEEKWASRIAQFILKAREEKPIETTGELSEIIKAAIPASARRKGPHPAKRSFQAIRIEVNGELEHLGEALESMVSCLSLGGRAAIITFHSLEDRIVKQTFARLANPCTCPPKAPMCVCGKKPSVRLLSRKPVLPSAGEIEENPRARSAKLRGVEKIEA